MTEVKSVTFTLTNNLKAVERPVMSGNFEVSGELTCYFEGRELFRKLMQGSYRQQIELLRLCRPYMTRRGYRRKRGRMAAAWKRGFL